MNNCDVAAMFLLVMTDRNQIQVNLKVDVRMVFRWCC